MLSDDFTKRNKLFHGKFILKKICHKFKRAVCKPCKQLFFICLLISVFYLFSFIFPFLHSCIQAFKHSRIPALLRQFNLTIPAFYCYRSTAGSSNFSL